MAQYRGSRIWEAGLEEAETAWYLVFHASLCHARVRPQASRQALLPRPEGVRTCHPKPASACWSLGAEGTQAGSSGFREGALPSPSPLPSRAWASWEKGVPLYQEERNVLIVGEGELKPDGSAQRHLFPRITLLPFVSHILPNRSSC